MTIRVQTGVEVDISAYRLDVKGKVSGDMDMIFYGQRVCRDNAVILSNEGVNTTYTVNLNRVNNTVEKIAFACTCNPDQTVSSLGHIVIQVEQVGSVLVSCNVDLSGRTEVALILGELYRRNNEWKFRFVSQGFNGGLKPLAEHFGVDVDEEQGQPQPISPPVIKPINLSKVSLTKNNPTVNLTKRSDYGLIKVNLNWNQKTSKSNGLLGGIFGSTSDAIDLDLGCFVRLKDGDQFVIQAVGKNFGDLDYEPYVKLLADDRTGSSTSGEWLHINGRRWSEIKEILVFAFIYDGVPNWTETDGVVTIHVPNEPPVETRLTEGGRSNRMCGIARLINNNGVISVERVNKYFSGHRDLDGAFEWGFRWVAGSK
ncbi:TerD family protein [Photobacterium carnosum]|uniref:TerD family protein n=1 Tax=Photobacterium carnosum TaxID=2023717 RepID=UPI00242AC914|nr:TerD family protein [Photobacterium carnosum]